ncbi:uncharacterized protein LOC131929755 [Physella acuta]|uniref:uncharacterized protein LOC131929755 n=1 Tax=Physella acuta TaxID=109671 RepID=UPI0027DE5C13|nr:uncharacterized protein LOC131929755 [Physella acuta]
MKEYSYPFQTNAVDKRSNLSLQEFLDVYDGKWPVIVTDIIPNWPAYRWTKKYFIENYPDSQVFVSINGKSGSVSKLSAFLQQLDQANQTFWSYLQDELFLLQHPELSSQLLTMMYTRENFFSLFPEEIRPWDCLLLWGTAFSRSTLHIDPYNWTGTNAVLSGAKKWKLILPGQDRYLSVKPDQDCGFPLDCKKYNSALDLFSNEDEANEVLTQVKHLEVVQLAGELLFIPTGWFHQALNVEPTLAVSGQVMNVHNYLPVLEEILKGGGLSRSDLPDNMETLTPMELVQAAISKVSVETLRRGSHITQKVLEYVNKVQNK